MTRVRPIFVFLTALLVVGALVGVSLARSEDTGETPAPTPAPTPAEATPAPTPTPPPETTPAPEAPPRPRTYFDYAVSVAREIEDNNDLLLWGRLPMRQPADTLGARISYQYRRIDSVYDANGAESKNLGRFVVPDPFSSSGDFLAVSPSLHGRIHRINLEASYGLTDSLTWYGRLPLQEEEMWLDFDFVAGSSAAIGIRTVDDWFLALEQLGRPAPVRRYRSTTWELGDMETGVSWNYLRSSPAYLTLAFRGFVPTGRLADPNQALIYGLGPQIDVGRGSFGAGVTHRVDYFFPVASRWLGVVLEANYDFVFVGKRRTPHFLKPDPTFYSQLDRLGVDKRLFPDLSHSPDYYYVTPGSQFDYLAGVSMRFHYFGVGAGFTTEWDEQPKIHGDSEIKALLDATNAYPARTRTAVVGEVGVPLTPLYVPGIVGLSFHYPVSGRNVLREEDNFSAQLQLFFPL